MKYNCFFFLQNLTELLARQQKMKYYQQVKDGKYTMLCRTPTALEMESQKQEERVQSLTAIVDRLNSGIYYFNSFTPDYCQILTYLH